MRLNLFTCPPLLAFMLSAALAVFAIIQNPRSPLHRLFAVWNGCVASWNLATLVLHTAPDAAAALQVSQWVRNVFLFSHPTYLHLILEFTRERRRLPRCLLTLAYLSAFALVLANQVSGWMVTGMRHYYWGYYPIGGPVAKVYPVFFFLTFAYALRLLHQASKSAVGHHRSECRILFWATVVMMASPTSNFLITLGAPLYPFGSLFSLGFSLMTAYVVTMYGLMDLRIALRKGFAYATLGAALTGTFVLIESLIKRMFIEHDTASTAYAFRLAAFPLTLAIAHRMRVSIEPLVQRMSIWRVRDREAVMDRFRQAILSGTTLEDLGRAIVDQLSDLFGTQRAVLYARSMDPAVFECAASMQPPLPPALSQGHPVVTYMMETRRPFHREQLLWETEHRRPIKARSELVHYARNADLEILVPLFFNKELIGILGLGKKQSQDMYNADDFSLLEALAAQATVGVSHARAIRVVANQQRQLDRQREMVLMGTLATEMAHELNKPLTHIMNEGARLERQVEGRAKINLLMIEREVKRASEILDGFALLAPHRTLHTVSVSLEDLLEEALAATGLTDHPGIEVVRNYGRIPNVWVNPGQIVQVFTNLLQNAGEAMRGGGKLTLSTAIAAVDRGEKEIRVSFTDTGPGIPAAIQSKIFDPFFTTRKSEGGRGVGLTLSRAMAARHGGRIIVESPVPLLGGTRMIVVLPWAARGKSCAA
jgi:signal transduction histidine kinase